MIRRALILSFLLGGWSAATLFMWQTAIKNFAVAEAVQRSNDAGLRSAVGDLPTESFRLVARHQASEVNRLFFRGWGWIQLPVAVAACLLAWRRPRFGWFVPGTTVAMLLIAVFLSAYVVPETIRLGRLMDFAGQAELPDVRSRFWTLHHTYTGLDMLKFVLGLASFGAIWIKAPST